MTAYGNILTAGYNGDGLRAWKQTALGRRYYLYDGEELVCELDAAGNPVAGVVFGANGLVVYDIRGYQFDPQGNATHLMDDDGLVLAHLAYDAWGQRMSGTNPTPYGYKGQWGYYTDAETGLLLLTHRYFDPATGRFLTRDPIGFEGGINLYAYVGNLPASACDKSGLVPKWIALPTLGGCIKVGLAAVCGVLVAAGACYACYERRVDPYLPRLGDKGLHCVAGCLMRIRCTAVCSFHLGWIKEHVFDRCFGGTVEEEDIPPTDDGVACGVEYKGGNSIKEQVSYCTRCCSHNGWK